MAHTSLIEESDFGSDEFPIDEIAPPFEDFRRTRDPPNQNQFGPGITMGHPIQIGDQGQDFGGGMKPAGGKLQFDPLPMDENPPRNLNPMGGSVFGGPPKPNRSGFDAIPMDNIPLNTTKLPAAEQKRPKLGSILSQRSKELAATRSGLGGGSVDKTPRGMGDLNSPLPFSMIESDSTNQGTPFGSTGNFKNPMNQNQNLNNNSNPNMANITLSRTSDNARPVGPFQTPFDFARSSPNFGETPSNEQNSGDTPGGLNFGRPPLPSRSLKANRSPPPTLQIPNREASSMTSSENTSIQLFKNLPPVEELATTIPDATPIQPITLQPNPSQPKHNFDHNQQNFDRNQQMGSNPNFGMGQKGNTERQGMNMPNIPESRPTAIPAVRSVSVPKITRQQQSEPQPEPEFEEQDQNQQFRPPSQEPPLHKSAQQPQTSQISPPFQQIPQQVQQIPQQVQQIPQQVQQIPQQVQQIPQQVQQIPQQVQQIPQQVQQIHQPIQQPFQPSMQQPMQPQMPQVQQIPQTQQMQMIQVIPTAPAFNPTSLLEVNFANSLERSISTFKQSFSSELLQLMRKQSNLSTTFEVDDFTDDLSGEISQLIESPIPPPDSSLSTTGLQRKLANAIDDFTRPLTAGLADAEQRNSQAASHHLSELKGLLGEVDSLRNVFKTAGGGITKQLEKEQRAANAIKDAERARNRDLEQRMRSLKMKQVELEAKGGHQNVERESVDRMGKQLEQRRRQWEEETLPQVYDEVGVLRQRILQELEDMKREMSPESFEALENATDEGLKVIKTEGENLKNELMELDMANRWMIAKMNEIQMKQQQVSQLNQLNQITQMNQMNQIPLVSQIGQTSPSGGKGRKLNVSVTNETIKRLKRKREEAAKNLQ